MTVSQNTQPAAPPDQPPANPPAPADAHQPDPAPRPAPERGWRWWFTALGPWVGVAVAVTAVILGR